jgi:flagellar hook-associated protein 1 FlgK
MYNQALTASSRFMTTMDEAMDTIINNMGIVGR